MRTSKSPIRNAVTKSIWLWCHERNIWLTAVHIPGVNNVGADQQCRTSNTSTEWSLNQQIFHDAISKLRVNPDIDFLHLQVESITK